MKKVGPLKRSLGLFIFVLFIGVLIFLILYNKTIERPLKTNEKSVVIEVRQGEGFYDVLNRLDKENKIFNKLLIKVKLSIDKRNIKLNEGIYEIETNSNLDELITALESTAENKDVIKLTIPEGYSIDEIAGAVEAEGFCTKEEFINAAKEYTLPNFVKADSKKRYNIEGFLYPDTYLIKKGSDANQIINMMIYRFNQVLNQVKDETGLNIKDEEIEKAITIAAMIEKEAKFDIDRPLISSVIYNRLEKGMKLQLDATVLYALGYHVDIVLNKHLEVDSPYNTYKYEGLPVGPICNPGIKSIKSALLPTKTDYLYYILQKDGTHYFSNNYDDFLNKKNELGY